MADRGKRRAPPASARRVVLSPAVYDQLVHAAGAKQDDPNVMADRAVREFLEREGLWASKLRELQRISETNGRPLHSLLDEAISAFLSSPQRNA